jgi:hypothetical protein
LRLLERRATARRQVRPANEPRPTYTTYVDRPTKVAEAWPIIDELTAEHGIVTSLFVPAYRERRGEHVGGGLRLGRAQRSLGGELRLQLLHDPGLAQGGGVAQLAATSAMWRPLRLRRP